MKATRMFCKKSSDLHETSCMHTTSKASMSYERHTHVRAMSKSPLTARLSTAANVAW